MTLRLCTLTGVDEKTSFDWVVETAGAYPFAEFGILFSLTPDDKDARYADQAFINRFADDAQRYAVNTALHICGSAVNRFVGGDHDVKGLASRFGRVQINFSAARVPFGINALFSAIEAFSRPVITQHHGGNIQVTSDACAPNHHVLFDASGGRGVHSTEFPARIPGKFYGYAGGFGPETIDEDIARAAAAAGNEPFWIDMESKIRTDGHLDQSLCETVLSRTQAWLDANRALGVTA